jgi:hypothetical protein
VGSNYHLCPLVNAYRHYNIIIDSMYQFQDLSTAKKRKAEPKKGCSAGVLRAKVSNSQFMARGRYYYHCGNLV